jgi:hypothetical protein
MESAQLQPQTLYSLPSGARMKVVDVVPNHEHYVIHPRHSYYRLDAKLLHVDAPQLAYRLFYALATELQHPYGNIVPYSIKWLCTYFHLTDTPVYAALAKLLMADVARKVQRQVVALDPYIAFAGDIKHRDAARQQWDADTLQADDPIYIPEGSC